MARPLWVRSIASRPLAALLLVLLSTVAVGTSALGPMVVRAVHQSALRDAVADADQTATEISIKANVAPGDVPGPHEGAVETVMVPTSTDTARGHWTAPRIVTETNNGVSWTPQISGKRMTLDSRVAITDDCTSYPLTAGRCPRTGQVAIGAADARRLKIDVGAVISYLKPNSTTTERRTIVGIYDPDQDPTLPLTRPGTLIGALARVTADPLIMSEADATALNVPETVTGQSRLTGVIDVSAEPELRATIDGVKNALLNQDEVLQFDSGVPELLDGVDSQAQSALILIAVTVIQVLALALFALSIVLQRIARARSAEWGVGRLRGIPRVRWLASVYVEPMFAVLVGLPLGLLASLAVADIAVRATLRPDTPVEPWRWPVLLAALAATGGAMIALVAVSARSVRRPLVELIAESTEARRLSPLGAAAQAVIVLLAAATLYSLVVGGTLSVRGSQLGLLAPALFALALAVGAVRVAVLVVRRITRRPSRGLTGLIVGRQAARTPSALNPAIVIAAGVAVAVVATQVLALSVRNQGLRADATVGAATVAQATVPVGVDLLAAVRSADPTGRYAMAAAERRGSAVGGISRIIAVDSSRLAAVSSWDPKWAGAADLATALHPTTQVPIVITGTSVTVATAKSKLKVVTAPTTGPPVDPVLVLVVQTKERWETVALGPMTAKEPLTAPLPCKAGCRVVSLGLVGEQELSYEAQLLITSLHTDGQADSVGDGWLRDPLRWRPRVGDQTDPDPNYLATPTANGSGLLITAFDNISGMNLAAVSTDTDDPLPAVIAPRTNPTPFPGTPSNAIGTGLDGQTQVLHVVGNASVLPRSLDDGVLVDLSEAAGLTDPSLSEAAPEVWFAPGAPADITTKLTAMGIRLDQREELDAARTALLQQPTTRGAAVGVTLGYAALVLALLTLLAARLADASRRRTDWSSLRDAGLPALTIRRLAAAEIALPPLLGTVIGLISGIAATKLAAPRLPLVDLTAPGPPLDVGLVWPTIGLIGGGVAVAVVLIGIGCALAETRDRAAVR